MSLASSELILNKKGRIYHMDLAPEDIADTIILVGDQDRVDLIGTYFDEVRFKVQNREFKTLTGIYKGKELSVVSTGIGTDNVDIVLNELDALVNIDLEKRTIKAEKKSLKFIRIGTCGALQEDIDPGQYVISKYAMGLDGVAHFYDLPYSEEEKEIMTSFFKKVDWKEGVNRPYIKKSSDELFDLLQDGMQEGITITANGFYGPQGRSLRLPLGMKDFKENIRSFSWNEVKVTNLEMETSCLYALSNALGHEAVTVCLALANRYNGKFLTDYSQGMKNLIQTVLDRLIKA